MLELEGLSSQVEIRENQQYKRPTAVPYLIADTSKFNSKLGGPQSLNWKIF